MKKKMWIGLFIRAAILFGFCLYIYMLNSTGHLIYYIAPRMSLYVKVSAMVFYLIGAYQLFKGFLVLFGGRPKAAACDCETEPAPSRLKSGLIYALFLLPLALGFGLPDAAMNSALAAKKGVSLSGNSVAYAKQAERVRSALANEAASGTAYSLSSAATTEGAGSPQASFQASSQANAKPAADADNAAKPVQHLSVNELQSLFQTDKYNVDFAKLGMYLYKQEAIDVSENMYMEILNSLALFPDNFKGKPIHIKGFVYREGGMKPNQFVVARFSVSCCSADASPYGVLVESGAAKLFANDTWVDIQGVLGTSEYDGNPIVKIDATQINQVKALKTPYVYTNYDFLSLIGES
jgi:uncharacterized repeat protein (TIGR03943 family)